MSGPVQRGQRGGAKERLADPGGWSPYWWCCHGNRCQREMLKIVCVSVRVWQKREEDTLERQHPPFTVCFKQSVVVLRNSGKHTKQTHKRAAWWFYIFCVFFFIFIFFNYKAAHTQTVCERWAISHIAPAGCLFFVCVREIFFSCIPPFVSVCERSLQTSCHILSVSG